MISAIRFSQLDVRRMPGFPRGGLGIKGIVDGINVIYGPNASGKTTLTRAMQRVLRPHVKGRHTDSLAAELIIADQSFEIDYHLGQVVCRSGGHDVPVPPLAPTEVDQRYVLALHDLVQQEDDCDIVQQILQEAAGGYDVAAAAQDLSFNRDRPSGRNCKVVREFEQSVRQRKKAEDRLVDIDRDARKMAVLERQRDKAYQAQLRGKVIQDALDALDKQRKLGDARDAVVAFPESMSKVVGDELRRLATAKKSLDQHRAKLKQESEDADKAKKDKLATELPEEGVSESLLDTLYSRCETLRGSCSEISRLDCELAAVKERFRIALKRLGPDVSPKRAAALDATMLDKLFKFVRQAEDQRLRGEASERLSRWLTDVPETKQSPDALRDGSQLLQEWLAQQRATPTVGSGKRDWLVAAGITAGMSVMLTFWHVSWLLLLVLAGGLATWAFLRTRLAVAPVAVRDIPAQWGAVGLSPPAAWTLADVQSTLRRLQQEWGAAQLHQEKSQRFADLQEHRGKYLEQQEKIERIRQSWRDRLGIEIDVDDSRLYLLSGAVHQAQGAQSLAESAQAGLEEACRQRDEILAAIYKELAPYAAAPARDAEQASALVRNLEKRRQANLAAVGRLRQAEESIQECNAHIKTGEAEVKRIFADVGLADEDVLTLRRWIDQLPQYQEACKELLLAENHARIAVGALSGHEELLELTRDQLLCELEKSRRLAEELELLDDQLGDIRGRVRRAKEESALENALAREEICLDELRAARDKDGAQLVGEVLFRYLARQQREFQQPGVLTRASELFSRITHGSYQLLIESGDPPRFRACDSSLGREQNLDELSSGTRLQLLLSVRVAFVEQQEQGFQLPLIFDETLGNSDEQRAKRIIEAAVEIARGGRQVFYFTAQHDELGKWRRVLEKTNDVTHREFDLARQRGLSEVEHAPEVLEFEPPQAPVVPDPGQDDWLAYGRRLNVPPLDRHGHVGGVHLWYVVDDTSELHRLLNHDITKWGQLQTLVNVGSANGLGRDSLLFRRAAATARLMEHLLRSWRQGRGKPVDDAVLEASGAVSEAFMNAVSQLCQVHDGDARRLIADLRAGKVPRFRAAQINALEQHFATYGCLDDRPILDVAGVREAVTPLVFADCENGLLSRERVDQLAAMVTR